MLASRVGGEVSEAQMYGLVLSVFVREDESYFQMDGLLLSENYNNLRSFTE